MEQLNKKLLEKIKSDEQYENLRKIMDSADENKFLNYALRLDALSKIYYYIADFIKSYKS